MKRRALQNISWSCHCQKSSVIQMIFCLSEVPLSQSSYSFNPLHVTLVYSTSYFPFTIFTIVLIFSSLNFCGLAKGNEWDRWLQLLFRTCWMIIWKKREFSHANYYWMGNIAEMMSLTPSGLTFISNNNHRHHQLHTHAMCSLQFTKVQQNFSSIFTYTHAKISFYPHMNCAYGQSWILRVC